MIISVFSDLTVRQVYAVAMAVHAARLNRNKLSSKQFTARRRSYIWQTLPLFVAVSNEPYQILCIYALIPKKKTLKSRKSLLCCAKTLTKATVCQKKKNNNPLMKMIFEVWQVRSITQRKNLPYAVPFLSTNGYKDHSCIND